MIIEIFVEIYLSTICKDRIGWSDFNAISCWQSSDLIVLNDV